MSTGGFLVFAIGAEIRNWGMLEILFFPVVLLAAFPGGAFLPAIIFTALYLKRRSGMTKLSRAVTMFATLTWVVYGVYETRMYFWMKTVIAPIRVDLVNCPGTVFDYCHCHDCPNEE